MADKPDPMAKVATFLGAAATALVAFNTWQVSQFDNELREQESDRELNFRIYESIAKAIETGNPQRIRAVRVLVEALVGDELKESYLTALDSGEVEIYASEQAVSLAATRPSGEARTDWGDWDYDIFWCSASGAAAESQATAIVAAIRDEGAEGRIRARVLPESIRLADPESSSEQYEVRYEASERKQAEAVGRIAGETIGLPGVFKLREIAPDKPTPWYVSVFVCPVATIRMR